MHSLLILKLTSMRTQVLKWLAAIQHYDAH